MNKYRYASWVQGEHLAWVKDQHYLYKDFAQHITHKLLTREDFKPKLKTLDAIAKLVHDPCFGINTGLDVASFLLNHIEDYHEYHPTARKKEVTSAFKQVRKSINNLFEVMGGVASNHSFDLIEGAPLIWQENYGLELDDHTKLLLKALKVFWHKSAHQVLLEYIDKLESEGTANPFFSANNRQLSISQIRVRWATFLVIMLTDIEVTKNLTGLAPLVATLVDLTFENKDPLCPMDVDKQIKTAIKICEKNGAPITME